MQESVEYRKFAMMPEAREGFRQQGYDYSFSWFPHWGCCFGQKRRPDGTVTSGCTYCGSSNVHYGIMHGPEGGSMHGEFREQPRTGVSAEDWIRAFDRIPGSALIDVSGGEPMEFPPLLKIMTKTSPRHIWGITSNLKHQRVVRRFVEEVGPLRCPCVTASCHPLADLDHTRGPFLEHVRWFRDTGYHVSVNFVLFPGQLHLLREFWDRVTVDLRVAMFLEPYSGGATEPFMGYTDDEIKLIEEVARRQKDANLPARLVRRNMVREHARDQASRIPFPPRWCNAGVSRMWIAPDGTVYPCNTLYMGHRAAEAMGNFLESDFRLLPGFRVCALPCECGGDRATVAFVPLSKTDEGNIVHGLVAVGA